MAVSWHRHFRFYITNITYRILIQPLNNGIISQTSHYFV